MYQSGTRALILFPNFILIASFLGIGLGVLMARRQRSLLPYFPALLILFVLAVGLFRFDLTIESPESLYFGRLRQARQLVSAGVAVRKIASILRQGSHRLRSSP